MNNDIAPAQLTAWKAQARAEENVARRPIRVFMMDLSSIVPYYTGHLCEKLRDIDSVQFTIGSIQYGHDKTFFQRMGLRTDTTLLSLSAKFPDRVAPLRRALKGFEYLINLAGVAIRFRMNRPDLVHVQFLPLLKQGIPAEIWLLKLVRSLGTKIVYTVHNVVPHENGRRDRQTYSRVYSIAEHLICHDLPARNRLVSEFGVPPDRISVIPHGPLFRAPKPANTITEARRALALPCDRCVVLFQGIIRPYKGISFLLKAWKKAHQAGIKGVLVIVGTGEADLLASIKKEIAQLGIELSVRLLFRFVTIEQLNQYYAAADVLVYPYRAVTTSGALMTGIGYGKAIVATALPAFHELLRHEENALLVGYGHEEGLSEALLRLASDEILRKRLGEQLLADSGSLAAWDDIAKRTVRVYAKVTGRRLPSSGRNEVGG